MKTTNLILRLCATLCLLAGLAAFGAGCGDDDNGDGTCASGEVRIEGVGCLPTCDSDDDCENGTCQVAQNDDAVSVCVGDSGGNNDTDAGDETDTGEDDNNDTDDEEFGDLSCGEVFQCESTCQNEIEICGVDNGCLTGNMGLQECATDEACAQCLQQNCDSELSCFDDCAPSEQGQADLEAFNTCAEENCANGGSECLANECQQELDTCAGCTGDASVDLSIGLGLECVVTCSQDSECPNGEVCEDPILIPGAPSLCSHDMRGLADSCTGDADCPAPDNPNAQTICAQQNPSTDEPLTGGFCVAFGCNTDVGYGLDSGCGLDGYCIPDGNTGYCAQLCTTQSDCPRGDEEQFSCSILQRNQDGSFLGTCDIACSDNADCQGGRCNDLGYCESPCDPSDANNQCEAVLGGTCEGEGTEGFCVFEDTAVEE